MFNSQKQNNFLIQGAILAIASIISRIIGLIYKVKVIGIIGDLGGSYYACSFDIYNIALIISSYSIPTAVSKLISVQFTKDNQYKVFQILKVSLMLALLSGAFSALILFIGAGWLTAILNTPYSEFSLRILSPALVIVALLGVLRGFFQGMGNSIPSAISQVLEQLINAFVSIWAAYILFGIGQSQGKIINDRDNLAAAYGAAGSTLGTNLGSVAALLFMIVILFFYIRKHNIHNVDKEKDDNFKLLAELVKTILPVMLATTVYNISGIIDQGIYKNIAQSQGYSPSEIHIPWGVYSCKYKLLINLPISIASAFAAASVASVAASYTSQNIFNVHNKIQKAISLICIIALPCTVGLMVLAKPIVVMLFPNEADTFELAAYMLLSGAIAVLFFSLSTITNALLQGIDRFAIPVRNSLIALGLHLLLLVILMKHFKLGIYAVIIANITLAITISFLNFRAIGKECGYHQEIKHTIINPLKASVIMGIMVFLSYKFTSFIGIGNTISVILAIAIGAGIYFAYLYVKGQIKEFF